MKFLQTYLKSLSVFLLAWFSVLWVYAALSTVNSGDPLTATSWNEMVWKLTSLNTNNDDLVTKSYVDSQISANSSGLSFAGYTSSSYNWDMGGIKWMNSKCNSEYSGSRVCGYDEIIKLWNDYPWTDTVWVHDGLLWAFSTTTNYERVFVFKDGSTVSSSVYVPTCNSFNYSGNNTSYRWTTLSHTNSGISNPYCYSSYKLACCNW